MATPYRVAIEVWIRDEGRCRYCDRELKPNEVEIDHHHPRALGGTDDVENLRLSCIPCNRQKSDKPARVADLWLTEGVPLCVAHAIHRFEQDLEPLPTQPWFVGAEWHTEEDGSKVVHQMPMAMGQCSDNRCPDCA